ncbi:MAG: hypothetical protein EOS54_17925 [Mesorhizobium sp.]|uniref:hypothetical protein n=1 Tax=unclassified Mesorhizobium TaxID=325217 RepID=UPI000F755664|nr:MULTISPECIES: hypothetical protein [unclassified Mesorhizobium]AZO48242.1 hypothetical protein EJ073_10750 [Mesorhizobium sp. M4B.F.Ca.ET.058.02.1.1]RUX46953.1 hypothetical protein EOA33_19765 [Mesorhizobium sp. M4A.F.Ca.ET.050.02.1.1]RVC43435.1 hypothetical protein EN781_18210 [Mesorhizobium sp. M4A.F.Ca.ET.090.04.2.1]RVC81003.1 hypothetical protein EN745_11130 [Mesorhizobium sp. M4A.F.Ca.ET.022.05.2.1]RVD40609.1 hypothetical protein EN742_12315 [Mesorhizobium sp. M4A.F.Ca.ET.020.02.1.1]
MMKLFQSGSCGQILYFCLLLFLVGFDFAKGPIEHFLVGTKEGIQDQVYASNGANIAQSQRSFVEGLKTPDQGMHPQPESVREHASGMVVQALAMEAKNSAIGTIYISMLVAMGFATIVAMIWMVLARVRDIGWPATVGFGVLAPKLAVSVLPGSLPPLTFEVLQYGFIAAIILLGFVPGGFAHGPRAEPVRQAVAAEPARRIPGQFGQRMRP